MLVGLMRATLPALPSTAAVSGAVVSRRSLSIWLVGLLASRPAPRPAAAAIDGVPLYAPSAGVTPPEMGFEVRCARCAGMRLRIRLIAPPTFRCCCLAPRGSGRHSKRCVQPRSAQIGRLFAVWRAKK